MRESEEQRILRLLVKLDGETEMSGIGFLLSINSQLQNRQSITSLLLDGAMENGRQLWERRSKDSLGQTLDCLNLVTHLL